MKDILSLDIELIFNIMFFGIFGLYIFQFILHLLLIVYDNYLVKNQIQVLIKNKNKLKFKVFILDVNATQNKKCKSSSSLRTSNKLR